MKLSQIITDYRKEHGYSQREFAKLCGVSHSYISLLEKETSNNANKEPMAPTIENLQKIAGAMGRSLHELLSEMDDMEVDLTSESELRNKIMSQIQQADEPQLREIYRYIRFSLSED